MLKNIYYLFGASDKFFSDITTVLEKNGKFSQYCGMAYAKTKTLQNKLFCHISYISDVLKQYSKEIDVKFLCEIEKKYHIVIADMIHADRHLMRYKKIDLLLRKL